MKKMIKFLNFYILFLLFSCQNVEELTNIKQPTITTAITAINIRTVFLFMRDMIFFKRFFIFYCYIATCYIDNYFQFNNFAI